MIKPKHLKPGDKVAIVSLSTGILGEEYCKHQLEIGVNRLRLFGLEPVFMKNTLKGVDFLDKNPAARAQDLKQAFFDDEIKGIISAIGGDDTYRLIPYLMSDQEFINKVKQSPKLFTGFSDTTNNHLMFYKLGVTSYYGPNFLTDLAELGEDMLPYTKDAFQQYFKSSSRYEIVSSPIWYEERTNYSVNAINTKRIERVETVGYDVIYGTNQITGKLLGGCLESIFDAYTGTRYPNEKKINGTYHLLPNLEDWQDKILFFETSEETPTPKEFEQYIVELETQGILSVVRGAMVGKPMNETYYAEYRDILVKYANKHELPIIYNVNFGHASPRTVIPYGLEATIDFSEKTIVINEPILN